MKTTHSIGCCFVALAWATPLHAGVGVRYIDLLNDYYPTFQLMSDDAQTFVNNGEWSLIIDRGSGWESITQNVSPREYYLAGGISDNGSVITFTGGINQHYIWRDGSVEMLKAVQVDGVSANSGLMQAVSGDGATIGILQIGEWGKGLYLYRDGAYLDMGLRREPESQTPRISGLDRTGSIATVTTRELVQLDAMNHVWQQRAWVWDNGELSRIPDLDLGAELMQSKVDGISSDGLSFYGSSQGFDDDSQLFGLKHGWVYRDGVQHSVDTGDFAHSEVFDLSDDGSIALVWAGIEANDNGEGYLWSQTDGLVMIRDILSDLGIEIPGDVLYFYSMSGDGRSLAGTAYHNWENRFEQFVVTIPTPGAMLMLGGGLLMLSGRRR